MRGEFYGLGIFTNTVPNKKPDVRTPGFLFRHPELVSGSIFLIVQSGEILTVKAQQNERVF